MMKERILEWLEHEAKSDESKARGTFQLLFEHPAGIGDHSTDDFYANARQALDNLVDAQDRLKAIEYLRNS
jgi:hypothetical protein